MAQDLGLCNVANTILAHALARKMQHLGDQAMKILRCGRSMFITGASLSFVLSRFCLPLVSFRVRCLLAC